MTANKPGSLEIRFLQICPALKIYDPLPYSYDLPLLEEFKCVYIYFERHFVVYFMFFFPSVLKEE